MRAGRVSNSFKGYEVKDEVAGKEIEYETETMYEGVEAVGGYKHKANEKIEMDCSLRYMLFGCQNGKNVKLSVGNEVKFENVISNRIRVEVKREIHRDRKGKAVCRDRV